MGLLIGWVSNPWFGAAFIWMVVIATETIGFQRKKKIEKVSPETQGASRV